MHYIKKKSKRDIKYLKSKSNERKFMQVLVRINLFLKDSMIDIRN